MESRDLDKIWNVMVSAYEHHLQAVVAGLGGGECSGKSYVADKLAAFSKGTEHQLVVIPLDGYLRLSREDRAAHKPEDDSLEALAFRIGDHPDCFDFKQLHKDIHQLIKYKYLNKPRRYNYELGRVEYGPEPLVLTGKTILLVEGIFALYHSLLDIYHLTFFVDADVNTSWQRYRIRHNNRGNDNSVELEDKFYRAVIPAYEKFIEPTRRHAQKII